jgi:hypothetical protein
VRSKNPQNLLTRYINKSGKKGSKKPKRKHTILEVYSDQYFKSKLQGLVNEELKNDLEFASLSPKKRPSYQLSVYRRIRADCWNNESDEVKAEIQNIFDEEHRVKDEENADGSDTETKDDDDDDDEEKILLGHQQE